MRLFVTISLLFVCSVCYSQKRRFGYKQTIPINYLVEDSYPLKKGKKVETVKGEVKTTVREIDSGGSKITYTAFDTLKKDTTFFYPTTKTYSRRLPGYANTYVKDDDYSKIYINYWLAPDNYFPAGIKLIYNSEGNDPAPKDLKESVSLKYYADRQNIKPQMDSVAARIEMLDEQIDQYKALIDNYTGRKQVESEQGFLAQNTLSKEDEAGADTVLRTKDYYLPILRSKLKEKEKELDSIYKDFVIKNNIWYAYTKETVTAKYGDEYPGTLYYKKYSDNAYISLKNRQFIKLPFKAWELAAITVPFKYRPSITDGDVTVPSQWTANFNVAMYLGHTWGKLKYSNFTHAKKKPEGKAFSFGGFAGFNVVELDSASTSLQGTEALIEKRTILSLTTGLAAVFNYLDFDIGVFAGYDLGFGDAGRKWNYSGEPWLGFGIGYNITKIGKSND